MSYEEIFRVREFRKHEGRDEQRYVCDGCGAKTPWHGLQDFDEVLSAGGWSTGYFGDADSTRYEAFCSACIPPGGITEGKTNMAKNGHAEVTPDRAGKTLVKLSREEREARGQLLAHERELFKALRKKKRTHVGEWNEQLRQMEETIDRLAEEVETGEAYVDSNAVLPFDKAAAEKNKSIAAGKKITPPKPKSKPKAKAKSREARA